MPARSITRTASVKGYAIPTAAPIYVNSSDNSVRIIPAGTGTTELVFALAAGASGFRMVGGSGALVAGTGTIATGLSTVSAIQITLKGATGFASGATEVSDFNITSVTTGSVAIQGMFSAFVTGATTLSVSGTAGYSWLALGT